MLNLFLRTLIVYFLLIAFMRIMGKRQIGELQLSELIITVLLSDIAVSPLLDFNTPLVYFLIPVISLLGFEIGVSFLITKSDFFKKLFDGVPTLIINKGKLDRAALAKLRISVNEFLSELRQQEISSVDEVDYAILEQNGKLSVIKKAPYQTVTRNDMSLQCSDEGFDRIIMVDGHFNKSNADALSISRKDVDKLIRKEHIRNKDVFLLTCNDAGNTLMYIKNTRQPVSPKKGTAAQ